MASCFMNYDIDFIFTDQCLSQQINTMWYRNFQIMKAAIHHSHLKVQVWIFETIIWSSGTLELGWKRKNEKIRSMYMWLIFNCEFIWECMFMWTLWSLYFYHLNILGSNLYRGKGWLILAEYMFINLAAVLIVFSWLYIISLSREVSLSFCVVRCNSIVFSWSCQLRSLLSTVFWLSLSRI